MGCCCDIDNDYLVKVRELGELLGELYIHKGSYSELTYSSQIFLSGILDDILMMNNEYINDEKEGLYKEYHENGQLKSVGKYENGKRVGDWKEYDENGKLKI